MYKKIIKIIVLCICSNGLIICMQEENQSKEAIEKGIIPILAVDNYVIPVSSAYRALKRESELPYESLEKTQYMSADIIKKKNDRIRSIQQDKYGHNQVHEIPFIKTIADILHPSGCSIARYIEITYAKKENKLQAYISAAQFTYRAKNTDFRAKKHSERRSTAAIELPLAMINKLPKALTTCYLLCLGDKFLLDRIIIKNMCNIQQGPPQPAQELAIVEPLSFSNDVHILNDDIEEYNDCIPLCRRMVSIVGFLLFIYLYS
jgi:hypothetical protein